MRELIDTPSSLLNPADAPAADSQPTAREEKRSEKLAKDFVRWCFSFGSDFRNSPDLVNLRAWASKTNLKLKESEEYEVVLEARKIHVKRLEQMMKKADTPILGSVEAEEVVSA